MEYESALAERERKDKEKADSIKARQIRLGDIPDPDAVEAEETSDSEDKPRAKAAPRKKSSLE